VYGPPVRTAPVPEADAISTAGALPDADPGRVESEDPEAGWTAKKTPPRSGWSSLEPESTSESETESAPADADLEPFDESPVEDAETWSDEL
jgi:hypothetical protein